ncbi:MAG TPA: glycosyltransferase family 4 protein [Alphaproteobacteria bacterium]
MSARNAQPGVLLVGTFPPPIDGMSVVNMAIRDAVQDSRTRVAVVDSSAKGRQGLAYHARRLFAHLRAIVLLLSPRGLGLGSLCHGVNAGLAMPYTLALVAAARLAGMRIVLYYHSSNYLRRRSALLAVTVRIAGPGSLHVLASEDMVRAFRSLYPAAARFLVVDNCAYVAEAMPARARLREPVRIGLLSNLSMEKGLGLAIDTARELRRRGIPIRLILAGPLVGPEAQAAAEAAERELGAAVEFRGTVLGDEKTRFYADIDVFLFPSLYPHETQSIVVPEAMAAGMPVLVHDHAFIRNLLAGSEIDHLLLAADGSFPIHAADAIAGWRADPARYAADSHRCRARFDELRRRGIEQFGRLIAELAPTPRSQGFAAAAARGRIAHGHD